MSGLEIAAIVTAAGAAAAAAFAVARTTGGTAADSSKQPGAGGSAAVGAAAGGPPGGAAPPADDKVDTQNYLTHLFGAWSGLLTTAGAIAAAVGGYQLAKDLGKGNANGVDQIHAVLAVAAFAFGIALLITIPVSLRARNRVAISDAVRSQRRWNVAAKAVNWIPSVNVRHLVVAPSSLFGYRDITEFEDATTALVKDVRTYWERGEEPPAALIGKLKIHRAQRARIEVSVATTRVRSASRRAVFKASAGMILAVAGFADATYITNHAERLATVADKTTEHDREVAKLATQNSNDVAAAATEQKNSIDQKILDAALAQPSLGDVLPTVPTDVIVSFPDAATAASALAVAEDGLAEACWNARAAAVYDVGASLDPLVPASRTIFVVFPRTDECRAVTAWIEPAWLRQPPTPSESAPETTDSETTAPDTTGG